MDNFLNRNLLALSRQNPELFSRLHSVKQERKRYQFFESRTGEPVPALNDEGGKARPLHSLIDPRKEAERLIRTLSDEGFLVFPGLGGGYYAEAALEREETCAVLVIEYDLVLLAELLRLRDYTRLFDDPRFRLFVDPSEAELERHILETYRPALYGGIRVIPLRPRTALDARVFTGAGNAVMSAIGKVSADYSVQAHFGTRWFSNIVRNLKHAAAVETAPPAPRAAVTAAGPSLSLQTEELKQERKELFLIAVDTSLPCLLNAGITPDAVISIDCQHISYRHFMEGLTESVLLFLDLASPPLLSSLAKHPLFFSGGHPLARYVRANFSALPELDCSGGNVTYAALSLAEHLGAREIKLYGADFSYPRGVSYARGAYIYPYFAEKTNRLLPLEAEASAFLFRGPLEKIKTGDSWYYETGTLKFYRERLEEKNRFMRAEIIQVKGEGAPIFLRRPERAPCARQGFSPGKAGESAEEFLYRYRKGIAALPHPEKNAKVFLSSLEKTGEKEIFTTMLPAVAAIKKRCPEEGFPELFEKTRAFCLGQIDKVISAAP